MEAKVNTQKNPRASNKIPPKHFESKLNPKKSHLEFSNLKNTQKGLNDIIRNKALGIECLCCLFIIQSEL